MDGVEDVGLGGGALGGRGCKKRLLTVQRLVRQLKLTSADPPLEFLTFVIHHGKGRWTAPTTLADLFSLWVPGNYRVVSRGLGEGPVALRDDLPLTILELEQEQSMEATIRAVKALQRAAQEGGGEYDRLMAECVAEMLVSTERTTQEQMTEVTTMAQVATEYQRSLDAFGEKRFQRGVQTGVRRGRDEGVRQGRGEALRPMVTQKFGPETAEELSSLLGEVYDPARLSRVASAVLECGTAEDFLARVRSLVTG